MAGIPVRNAGIVVFSRHYGLTVHTCVPCDPASKGGSESSVKIAKADLVPKDTNLLDAYESFAELEAACARFCQDVNARVHRVTRRAPVDMLAEEQARLHPVPAVPHTVGFEVTRPVAAKTPMVAFEGGQYSVPAWRGCRHLGRRAPRANTTASSPSWSRSAGRRRDDLLRRSAQPLAAPPTVRALAGRFSTRRCADRTRLVDLKMSNAEITSQPTRTDRRPADPNRSR